MPAAQYPQRTGIRSGDEAFEHTMRHPNRCPDQNAYLTTVGFPSTSHRPGDARTSLGEHQLGVGSEFSSATESGGSNLKKYSVGPAFRACSTTKPASAAAHPVEGRGRGTGPWRCRSSFGMISTRGNFWRWYRARSSRSSSIWSISLGRTKSQEQAPTSRCATVFAEG